MVYEQIVKSLQNTAALLCRISVVAFHQQQPLKRRRIHASRRLTQHPPAVIFPPQFTSAAPQSRHCRATPLPCNTRMPG
jgi:hypothetical protein